MGSSRTKFNRNFAQLEIDINYSRKFRKLALSTSARHHKALLSSSFSSQLAVDNNLHSYKLVFSLANETYKDYKHQGKWDKALCPDVGNASAMVNDPSHPSSNNKCWNCGELDCNVMTCPKPKDAARIVANRNLFYHQKQKDREVSKATKDTPKTPKAAPFAWRLPEPHENNKQVINGRPHIYNPAKPGWDEDENPPRGLTASKPLPSTDDNHTIQTQDESQISVMQLKIANLKRVSGIQ